MKTKVQQINQQIQAQLNFKNKEISDLKAKLEEQLKVAPQTTQNAGAAIVADKRIDQIQNELAEMQRSYALLKIEN